MGSKDYKFCVIDTERIKGNQIYLFSYQLYNAAFELVESKTYQDVSVDVSNRKSPKRKTNELKTSVDRVDSFGALYDQIKDVLPGSLVIVFSLTDVNVIKKKCKDAGIDYCKIQVLDLQKALYDLATDEKKKSNLKTYCKQHGIEHQPHIPESDCYATFQVYRNLLREYGEEFLEQYKSIV